MITDGHKLSSAVCAAEDTKGVLIMHKHVTRNGKENKRTKSVPEIGIYYFFGRKNVIMLTVIVDLNSKYWTSKLTRTTGIIRLQH